MVEIGRADVIARMRANGDSFCQTTETMIAHSNRYGWMVRLNGWTGPAYIQHTTRGAAEDWLRNWVAQSPERRCAFVLG